MNHEMQNTNRRTGLSSTKKTTPEQEWQDFAWLTLGAILGVASYMAFRRGTRGELDFRKASSFMDSVQHTVKEAKLLISQPYEK